jgi:hypothetical protein
MTARAFTAPPAALHPGSREAIKGGCTCDPDKNHYGRGEPFTDIYGKANTRCYIALYCPMHSEFKAPRDPEQAFT